MAQNGGVSSSVELMENNMAKVTLNIDGATFEKAVQAAYLKNRGKISLPGFRKGKVPRKMIEVQYGKNFFYEDALDMIFPEHYEKALDEHKLDVVSRPSMDSLDEQDDGGVIFSVTVFTKPVIEAPDYKGLTYVAQDAEVTDDEVNRALEHERQQNVRILTITDRPAQDGDIVIINFEGFAGGEPFEGGKAEGYELTLGSGSFIDTFEKQIEGHNIDDEFDVNVTFPAEYHAEALAGQPALFKVKVLEIKHRELPEIDDIFAQEVSEHETLEEYKAEIKAKIGESKTKAADREMENQLAKELAKRVEADLPESMVDDEVQRMIRDSARQVQNQGMDFGRYMQMMGVDADALRGNYRPGAIDSIKGRLAMEAIALQENIQVSDEEYEKELDELCVVYEMKRDEFLKAIGEGGKDNVIADIKAQKVMELMKAAAVAVESKEGENENDDN
ncbi:MAG: trigger factor [Defluviitaleaceae bacterium]|nr:trigger factor [Defluviitaleaceae bacterium]